MDSEPFVAWSLFSPAKTKSKVKDQLVEEIRNASSELSLSFDYMFTATDKPKEETNRNKGLSLELIDFSLELSLSEKTSPATDKGKQERFGVGECPNQFQRQEHIYNINNCLKPKNGGLSLELNLGLDNSCTSKKRERMENISSNDTRRISSSRNKKLRVKKVVSTELRLGHDPWSIKKQLSESDISNMSRLMLASECVESHVFPFWNDDKLAKIKEGLEVSVWDCDTKTEHELVFKQWNKGANVLIKNWVKDFVKRRELKVGDEIGLYWDKCNSTFKFSVLHQVASH
ncbi:hypothetical protein CRYUN_Cryun41cG0055500 [Craigia yunnanensis]